MLYKMSVVLLTTLVLVATTMALQIAIIIHTDGLPRDVYGYVAYGVMTVLLALQLVLIPKVNQLRKNIKDIS